MADASPGMKAVLSRLRPALLLMLIAVAISTVTRVVLAARPDVAFSGGIADWLRIFGYGFIMDVVSAAYIASPLVLWLALAPKFVARSVLGRALVFVAVMAFSYGCLVLALSEWLFWDEFGGRFNFIAVDYLLYTHEVLGNIWQSYPVGKLLLALVLPILVLGFLLRRLLWRRDGAEAAWTARVATLGAYALLIGLSFRYIDSDLHRFSTQDAANDLAGNGLYEFFAANWRNELSYDRYYATIPLPEAIARVRDALETDPRLWLASTAAEGVERRVIAPRPARGLNVVLVSEESLGAEFLGSYGNSKGLTPNLDRLEKESLSFRRVYATGNRTVRGMEALSLALPPTPGQSIVRRPGNSDLFTLGSVLEDLGYTTLFAYGGYSIFDNLGPYFSANDYRVIDRREIPSSRIEFENIWGVADEHLFDLVVDQMDREKREHPEKPVFVHVMTTSNHRPYTYPPGRIDIPSGTGRDGAVKYSDYAIGRFIDAARAKPWFDDTIFVLTADHGANARGTMRIPVDKYLIPVMVYSPKNVRPGRFDRLMSQIDIAPTLLGLLDATYYSKFFGRDVLRADPSTDRAFVANYQTLGYLKDDRMIVLQPGKKIDMLRMTDAGTVPLGSVDAGLARDAIAFYQTASYLFRSGLYRDEEQLPLERRR
jgi:phosphoglycerol transferase MdoB-like AlkP superfamily enzyme